MYVMDSGLQEAEIECLRAGLVPGLVCLIATPLILYVIYPPEVKNTPDAPEKAR